MKKISMVLVLAIMGFGLSQVQGQDTAADVKTLDAKLTECFKSKDFEKLGKHMAEDYMIIDPRGGIHNKTKYLKHLTDGTAKFDELKETDVKAKVFGDTAVVTGLLHIKGKVKDKEFSGEYRWTRVYNKKGDMWLCVLEQHTHVLPKEKEEKKPRGE